jgi:hypothetical protein
MEHLEADNWVRLTFWGEAFSPQEAGRRTGLALTTSNEPGDIASRGRYKGKPRPYGSAELLVPNTVARNKRMQWLRNLTVNHMGELRACGATDMVVDLTVLNSVQGNWELDQLEIEALASLNVPLSITICQPDEEDERV